MSNSRGGWGFWIRAWWPVAVGVVLIAMESTERFGSNHTSPPLRWLFEHLFGPIANGRWEQLHMVIRKIGHFLGYGGLGLTWLRGWWLTLPQTRLLSAAAMALLSTAAVASCDEWHQTFLPNRSGSPRDVLLDCCGAFVLIAITSMIAYGCRRRDSTAISAP